MASSYIKVSQQGLASAASRIRQAKEDYDHALQVIESTINSLDSVWQGSAQAAMKERYESKKATFRKFSEEIGDYANEITAFRNDIAQRDQSLASQIK